MKARNEAPLIASSFQLLDACEKSFLKNIGNDADLSQFEFEIKRIANFYADATICQIYWKNDETGKNSLVTSIDARETSQKNLDNVAVAFQAVLRNGPTCETFLCLIRDEFDLPFEADRIALQAKGFVINALHNIIPDISIDTSAESIQEEIQTLKAKKQALKKTIVPASKRKTETGSYAPKPKAEDVANDIIGKKSSNEPANVDPNDLMKDLMGQRDASSSEPKTDEIEVDITQTEKPAATADSTGEKKRNLLKQIPPIKIPFIKRISVKLPYC